MTSPPAPDDHPDAAYFAKPFAIQRPQAQTLPVVFDSPHSGHHYPPSLLARTGLDAIAIRRSEDCFVDQLFAGVIALGAPLLSAHFPRAYLDVNREPYELDPGMFSDPLPPHANSRTERVAAGLGTIARVVADGSEIYREKLVYREVEWRIRNLHRTYHAALEGLLDETARKFGAVLLVDCHSMPSLGGEAGAANGRADIVLGDRFGGACHASILAEAELFLRKRGYRVVRNVPYAGGYICSHYGRPLQGRHVFQIEVNRALYMSESRLVLHDGFARVAADLTGLAPVVGAALLQLLREAPTPPLAAE